MKLGSTKLRFWTFAENLTLRTTTGGRLSVVGRGTWFISRVKRLVWSPMKASKAKFCDLWSQQLENNGHAAKRQTYVTRLGFLRPVSYNS